MLRFLDRIKRRPTGHLICNAYRNGTLIDALDAPNLVVNLASTIQANALAGTAGYAVTQMGYGTNPTTPALTDTVLTSPFYKAFDSVTYPAPGQVQFNFSLGINDANNVSISEFGLVTTNGKLFARKVRLAPLLKLSDITLAGSWVITF